MQVFPECRNADVSVFGKGSLFSLEMYLKLEFQQNAGMKEEILNGRLLKFLDEYIF